MFRVAALNSAFNSYFFIHPSYFIFSRGSHYFAVFFLFFFVKARRSVFFRRFARFLTLSLPLLCPINVKFHPVVVSEQRDETEAGVCVVAAAAAIDSVPARPHPELS